jgi:hypothetical protein
MKQLLCCVHNDTAGSSNCTLLHALCQTSAPVHVVRPLLGLNLQCVLPINA